MVAVCCMRDALSVGDVRSIFAYAHLMSRYTVAKHPVYISFLCAKIGRCSSYAGHKDGAPITAPLPMRTN
jgi:hypothetical protein